MKRKTIAILVSALAAGPILAAQPESEQGMQQSGGVAEQSPAAKPDAGAPTPSEHDSRQPAPVGAANRGEFLLALSAGQLSSDDLIGLDVVDARDEPVGKIDSLMLESDGRVAGAILSLGGVFGFGGKQVGVSWDRLMVRADQNVAVLDATKSELERAPEFQTRRESWIERSILGEDSAAPRPGQPSSPDESSSDAGYTQ